MKLYAIILVVMLSVFIDLAQAHDDDGCSRGNCSCALGLNTYWLLVLMCLTDWLRINLFWFAGVASKIKNFIEIKDSKAYLQCFVHRLWLAKDRSRRAI
jgi:hypothetical protein